MNNDIPVEIGLGMIVLGLLMYSFTKMFGLELWIFYSYIPLGTGALLFLSSALFPIASDYFKRKIRRRRQKKEVEEEI